MNVCWTHSHNYVFAWFRSEEIVKFRNQQQQVEAELKQYKEEKLAKQRNLEEEKRMVGGHIHSNGKVTYIYWNEI